MHQLISKITLIKIFRALSHYNWSLVDSKSFVELFLSLDENLRHHDNRGYTFMLLHDFVVEFINTELIKIDGDNFTMSAETFDKLTKMTRL